MDVIVDLMPEDTNLPKGGVGSRFALLKDCETSQQACRPVEYIGASPACQGECVVDTTSGEVSRSRALQCDRFHKTTQNHLP